MTVTLTLTLTLSFFGASNTPSEAAIRQLIFTCLVLAFTLDVDNSVCLKSDPVRCSSQNQAPKRAEKSNQSESRPHTKALNESWMVVMILHDRGKNRL